MACPTILQTFILATVLLDLNAAMPTTSEPQTPTCSTCSVQCSNGQGQKCTATCNDKGLSQVPNECSYVENLHISGNSVHRITRTTFESFHDLELLKMKNNGIDTIEGGSFAETRLETIDLSSNGLQSLDKDVFLNLTTLTHIKVARNNIKYIEQYNLPTLAYLDMSDNKISEIRRSNFSMMTLIRHLHLSRNLIAELENNFLGSDMIHLTTLDLSGNKIESINPKAFYYLTNLEKLDLSGNDITDEGFPMSAGALFERQNHLKILSISNNKISSLKLDMLRGLQKNLTEFSADNNQISMIEAGIFKQLKFQNLTKLNLANNNLGSNFSKEFVPLLENRPTPKIELQGNPLCEEYQTVFEGQYNKSIFCSTTQMMEYIAREQNVATTEQNATGDAAGLQSPTSLTHETLKLICILSGVVLVVLIMILLFLWKKSKNRRTGNYTTCMTNRGYQYPSGSVSQPETSPPPVPAREPFLDEAYANTMSSSYTAPNNHSTSANGHLPSTNQHPPSSNRHPPSSHRHQSSSHRHQSSSNKHPPSSNRHAPSSSRQSFRRSILKRLPSFPYRTSSDQPIIVIGTITGTTTGTTRIEGLPQCKSIIKKSMSHNHKKPPKSTAQSEEEEAYMIRDETDDGKPKTPTMASYRSVQD